MNMNRQFASRACATFVVVFMLTSLSSATYKTVYNFTGAPDGGDPATQLTFDRAGNAYGTTAAGGSFNFGTVFKISPSGKQTVLYSFSGGVDGLDPPGGGDPHRRGNLYCK